MGSYVNAPAAVSSRRRHRTVRGVAHTAALAAVALGLVPVPVAAGAQGQPAPPVFPADGPTVRLQLRVFDGVEDVTRDTRLRLYPAGRRDASITLTLGPDQAFEADVVVGLYDVQAIREKAGEVTGVRWVERLLVQRYPDEFGRHLQVINLRSGFGALQIRPEGAGASSPGWSAVATPPGTPATEVAKARPLGPDLLLVVPSGTYDVKVTLPNAPPAWLTGIDIPDSRTRLKLWPVRP
jgi:hypothetical protein